MTNSSRAEPTLIAQADVAAAAGGRPCLRLYVAPDCMACEAALAIFERAREAFPVFSTDVVDLAEPESVAPDHVFATPTFTLNDRIIFLGTPSWEDLRDRLQGALTGGTSS